MWMILLFVVVTMLNTFHFSMRGQSHTLKKS